MPVQSGKAGDETPRSRMQQQQNPDDNSPDDYTEDEESTDTPTRKGNRSAQPVAGEDTEPQERYVKMSDVDAIIQRRLDERDQAHQEELAQVRSTIPTAMVPPHSGGPGSDNHQRSWSLAEQEVAARGDTLDHWDTRN